MLSILFLVGVALAQTVKATDHLECDVPADGAEMQCWPAQSTHDLGDTCADSTCPQAKALHVHVEPAVPVAMRESAPWLEPEVEPESEPEAMVSTTGGRRSVETIEPERPLAIPGPSGSTSSTAARAEVRVNTGGDINRRSPRTYHAPAPRRIPSTGVRASARVRVMSTPAYRADSYDVYAPVYSEGITMGAVSDFRASQNWISGVRAENQAYQTRAQVAESAKTEADVRADRAQTARKAEEARRLVAQAKAQEAERGLDTALDVGGELVDEVTRLRAENAALRAKVATTNPTPNTTTPTNEE